MKTNEQRQAEKRIQILDRRLGEGVGAKKERTRLAQKVGFLMCSHYYDPVRHPYLATGCLIREYDEFLDKEESRRTNEPNGY